jgi:hypothetical protein
MKDMHTLCGSEGRMRMRKTIQSFHVKEVSIRRTAGPA